MDSLLKLKTVKNADDVFNLRELCNNVENSVNNLKCLDVQTFTYVCLLIPILKVRLPDDLILLISKKFEANVWAWDRLLKYISDELIAKETCDSIFNSKTKSHSNDSSKRGSRMMNDGQEFRKDKNRCVYCNSESHFPSQWEKLSNVKSRIEILRRNFRRLSCLKSRYFF